MGDNSQLALLDLAATAANNGMPDERYPVRHPHAGRPKGALNKKRSVLWRMAEIASESIMRQMILRAQRLEDQLDFQAAQLILSRTWPKLRSAPVQIDLSSTVDARQLLVAMAEGHLTPSDAASLLNSLNRNGNGATAAIASGGPRDDDIREQIAERFRRIIEDRNARTVERDIAELRAETDDDDAADRAALEELIAEADEEPDA